MKVFVTRRKHIHILTVHCVGAVCGIAPPRNTPYVHTVTGRISICPFGAIFKVILQIIVRGVGTWDRSFPLDDVVWEESASIFHISSINNGVCARMQFQLSAAIIRLHGTSIFQWFDSFFINGISIYSSRKLPRSVEFTLHGGQELRGRLRSGYHYTIYLSIIYTY